MLLISIIPLWEQCVHPIDVTRLIVETFRSRHEDFQAKILLDPVRKHIHPSYCSGAGPDILINDPLLIPCPINLRILGRYSPIFHIVDCGFPAIDNARRSKS